jgi:uncharacterized protein YndB with AHSA1/START domain
MSFTAKIQCTIHAPVNKVWAGLTEPELVKQYFFGTQLVTSWEPGTPIFFRGAWEGKSYEDKGTVLKFEPCNALEYNYFSSWSDQEDRPENYQTIRYQVKPKGNSTVLIITQRNIETLDKKVHSVQNWTGLLKALKQLMESKS